jgi:phosphomannomutase
VLARRPGPVVTNLSSSTSIRDAAARAGQTLHRAPVGEANVAALMGEVGAVVGGEGNGGVMLPELHATRDAPLAAALVLQLLADRGATLEELLAGWPGYHIAKRKADRPDGPLAPVYEALEEAAADGAESDRQDGLRLEWPDGRWVHLRPSGTEPIVRIVAEARNAPEADALAEWAGDILRRRAQANPK